VTHLGIDLFAVYSACPEKIVMTNFSLAVASPPRYEATATKITKLRIVAPVKIAHGSPSDLYFSKSL